MFSLEDISVHTLKFKPQGKVYWEQSRLHPKYADFINKNSIDWFLKINSKQKFITYVFFSGLDLVP